MTGIEGIAASRDNAAWFDAHFKKRVSLVAGGRTLRLAAAHDLFSSHAVDTGTRMLLRSLERAGVSARRALDLGCGYGPIGLALRATGITEQADLVDRDALAALFAARNATDSAIDGVRARASLGYDDLADARYDLIACNVPGKAGRRVIEHLVLDARARLTPGGMAAVVVVAPLAGFVGSLLEDDATVEVLVRRDGRTYSVFQYRFIEPENASGAAAAFERGVYDAATVPLTVAGRIATLRTVQGIDEEGGPGLTTEVALGAIARLGPCESAFVLNPGQGYLPVALALTGRPSRLSLVDRDLLALRASARNVASVGFDGAVAQHHCVGMARGVRRHDLGVVMLREGEGPRAVLRSVEAATGALGPGGTLVVVGSSTAATRVVGQGPSGLRLVDRQRRKGLSALVFELT